MAYDEDDAVQAQRTTHLDWLLQHLQKRALFGLDEAHASTRSRWGSLFKLDDRNRAVDARIERQFPRGEPELAQ